MALKLVAAMHSGHGDDASELGMLVVLRGFSSFRAAA
jgi:hypothetical protein